MTTAVFARAGAMADQVRAEARRIDPGKAVLTALLLAPFLLGFLAGALVRGVWATAATVWAALAVGFRTALGDRGDEPA